MRKLSFAALRSVDCRGLHMAWCMYLTAFCLVLMEYTFCAAWNTVFWGA